MDAKAMTAPPISVTQPPARDLPRDSIYRRNDAVLLPAAGIVAILVLWQIAWSLGWISPLFFSGPSAIARRFIEMVQSGELQSNASFSGKNFLFGFVIAVLVAVPAGIVIGWYRRLGIALNPLLNAFYATPRIALYPLIIIWFGIGSGSAVFLVFLASAMPILLNTIAGVRNIDSDLLRAARAFCATDRQIFVTVALPSSVPFILTGVRQAVAHGLIAVIIAELTAGNHGIGFMIAQAGQTFATDTLLVGVLLTSFAGMLLSWLTERLERYFQRWRTR